MSIIFFGTPEFAVPSLKALINTGEKISLIVTQADKRQGRGHKLIAPPVKITALEAGIKIAQPLTLKDQTLTDHILLLKPEFIIVAAYGKLLPKAIIEAPEQGCINVHASLLPKYRGAAPIAWAIIKGEKKTGITTMLMDEGLDTGDVLLQQGIEITEQDTTETLGRKLSCMGAELLIETLGKIRRGLISPVSQTGDASYAPAMKKDNGLIDWSKSAGEIFNFVRGMQPWPGAYCYINNERVKLVKIKSVHGEGVPGIIKMVSGNEFTIGTGRGIVSVLELQPSGKKNMPVSAFIQGRKLSEGMSAR